MIKLMFICLGNICRSPMAHGYMEYLINKDEQLKNKVIVDSSGTGAWHIGALPDQRMRTMAKTHGIILNHRAQQLSIHDIKNFNYLLAMDQSNLEDIKSLSEGLNLTDKLFKFRDFDTQAIGGDVPDPYYGNANGFENVFKIVQRTSENLLNFIKNKHFS